MAGPKLSAAEMAERRQAMLHAAFQLFSERNIDSVTLSDVAAESGYPLRTVQRYFHVKENLVDETATWAFEGFMDRYRIQKRDLSKTTGAEDFEFFLDSFLALYRDEADLLRFNQFFNIYVRAEHIGADQLHSYGGMIGVVRERFRALCRKGQQDGTLRTDIPADEMFSITLHLMLAAVTRYAVGLVYDVGVDPERELLILRDMLLERYTVSTEPCGEALKRAVEPGDMR